jgi:uncharacterized protein YecE (DUF72 family)
MTAKDYLDPKGYWVDPSGNIPRMSGEQEIMATVVSGACSEAEWKALCGIAEPKSQSTQAKPDIRWLGDHKSIEEQTTTWDEAVVDRTWELTSWVDFCYQMIKRGVIVFAYANNHYAGHAPATIKQFQEL